MERAVAGLDAGGSSVGKGRALLPAAGSCGAILVAATAFLAGKGCDGIDRRTGVGVGIEAVAALGADAAPLAQQQSAAEQVGPDLHAVVAELVTLGANADQGGGFREERQLDGDRAFRAEFAASGHGVAGSVSREADSAPAKS